jgi:hypothetical protein
LHDNVVVPDPPVTCVGAGQVRPAGVDAVTVNVTVPVKPLLGVIVIVDVPALVAKIEAGETTPAEIEKSG